MTPSNTGREGDWRVAAALASGRLPARVAKAARAVLNGFWLGVLTEPQLAALDERYYAGTDLYRTDTWNTQGLFAWEHQLVADHLPPGGRVVVVAAGGGREVLALRDAGFDAVGYESHPSLAAFGADLLARRGHPGCVHPAPRDAVPAEIGPCDAVVVGWGAYSLIGSRTARTSLLAAVARATDGPVLVSYFEQPAVTRERRWTVALANGLRRVRSMPPVEAGDTLSPNRVHMFGPGELRAEAADAGLDVVTQHTVAPADEVTSYAAAVLRRRR